MLKKYLLILIASTALMTNTGCSLFSSDTEEKDEAVAEETTAAEPGTEGEEVLADATTEEEEVVDEYPDDDYGDGSKATAGTDTTTSDTTIDTTTTTETAAADQLPDAPMENGASDETLYVAGDTPATEDTSSSSSTTTTTSTVRDSYDNTSNFLPVRKMKTSPYKDGNSLINRLYIVRDGDNMKKISTKVYGDDSRAKDLYKWNTNFKGKSLNVGDKVYYASARNPADSSAMLLYYEEAGIQPTMYSAKKGESIRKVSQTLLGHPRSWMEVWATNDVESKWAMASGTQLRYWPEGAAAGATPITQANTDEGGNPAPAVDEASGSGMDEGQNMAANEELPPPSEDMPADDGSAMAQNDQNNNANNAAAAGSLDEPPPSNDVSTPPPPPPTAIAPPEAPAENGLASMMGGQDDSMMMAALGGLLILAALILLIFIKRSRKKVKYS